MLQATLAMLSEVAARLLRRLAAFALDPVPEYRVTLQRDASEDGVLTIGQIAAAADVNVETLRYYERRGLLPPTGRTASGYRQYSAESVRRLRFIRHAQDLGFSLEEIRDLLALRVRNGASCNAVAQKTRSKIQIVEQRIGHLQRMKRTLEGLATACAARRTTEHCPILEALGDDHAGS